jgi:hypothetical protein
MVEQGTPETELLRDEKGKFVPRPSAEDFTTEKPTDKALAAAETPKEGEAAPEKDGEVVPFQAADPSKLVTHFTLKDAKGELAIPEGLTIEFKANGKMRAEPLDRVVKFAEMGVYNHEREQRTQQVARENEEIQHNRAQVQERLDTREAQLERLLSDEQFRERALQEYQNQQTPEAKAARLDAERAEFQVEQERVAIRKIGEPYYEKEVVPSLEMLAERVPNVSREELIGKLKGFTDRLIDRRTGLIHPQNHQAINQHFLTDIIPWATQLDEYRAFERGTKSGKQQQVESAKDTTASTAEKEALQVRAQKARRAASANLRPPGRVGTPNAPKSTLTAKSTHQQRMDDVISSTLAAAGLDS